MQSNKRILVVDDSDGLRFHLKGYLEMEGFEVACGANGQEALDYLRTSEPPCVILLDLNMPLMDGREFRREQRNDPPSCGHPGNPAFRRGRPG